MNPILENLTGTAGMTDQIIAADLLISAKSGVRNYAIAITECATEEIRDVIYQQLQDAITAHEQILQYMMQRDWYNVYDASKQITLDLQNAQTTLSLQ